MAKRKKSTPSNDRNIPLPLQREIRQRCGFGCVVCGSPLYEYHHVNRWADIREHSADNITLLCDTHHRQADSELLPKEKIIQANQFPHNNIQERSSNFPLYYEGDTVNCILGNNSFKFPNKEREYASIIPLMIHGDPIISFVSEKSNLLLSLTLYDSSDNIVLKIVDNNLFYSMSPWDVQFVGRTLTIREKIRNLLIKITFNPPDTIIIDEGRVLHKSIDVLIQSTHLSIIKNGNKETELQGCSGLACGNISIGLLIGELPLELINRGVGICFRTPG